MAKFPKELKIKFDSFEAIPFIANISTMVGAEIAKQLRPPQVETILPLAEAARALHVQPITLRRAVQSNKIGYLWDGKGYFFKVSDLNDYLEKHYTPAQN